MPTIEGITKERRWLPLDQIHLPDNRLRPLDEAAAQALAELIREQGQLSPIAVYSASANKTKQPYTLIYGARRHRAMQILGEDQIEIVLRAKADAAMLEITDNFKVPGLSELEAADFLSAFRKLWEEKNGEINRGGDRKSKSQNDSLILSNYYKDLRSLFGLSKSKAVRLQRISKGLRSGLQEALRGTPAENNQTDLLRYAKMPIEKQDSFAAEIRITGFEAAKRGLKPNRQTSPKSTSDPETDYRLWELQWEGLCKEHRLRFLTTRVKPQDWEPEASVQTLEPTKTSKTVAAQKSPTKAANKPARKSPAGRKADPPTVKREKTFRRLFIVELTEQLLLTKLAIDAPHIGYLRKQPVENQFVAACWMSNGHGHDLDDLKWKIELEKDNAAEWYANRNAETVDEDQPV